MGINRFNLKLHKDVLIKLDIYNMLPIQVLILQPAFMFVYGENVPLKHDIMLKSNGP